MVLIVNEILVKTTHVNCSNIECVPHTHLLHTSRRKAFLLCVFWKHVLICYHCNNVLKHPHVNKISLWPSFQGSVMVSGPEVKENFLGVVILFPGMLYVLLIRFGQSTNVNL